MVAYEYRRVLGPGSPSPVVLGLMVLCGVVFLLGYVPGVGPWLTNTLALVPGVSTVGGIPGVGSGRVWQLVTYSVVHSGPLHIVFNMLMLYMFGCRVERTVSSRTFAGFVVVAAATAGVCSCLLSASLRSGSVQVMGASGIVFATLTMWALYWPNEEVWVLLLFPVRVKWVVLVLVALGAVSLLRASDGIAHEAHLGGCLAAVGWWWWTVRRPGSGSGRPSGRRRHLRIVGRDDERFRQIVKDL